MSEITTATLELIEQFEAREAEHTAMVLNALSIAQDLVVQERNERAQEVAEVRAEHVAGRLKDGDATYILHLLADEDGELLDELRTIESARERWCKYRLPPLVDSELAALLELDRHEARKALDEWRAVADRTPAPTWPPITDAEIAEWRAAEAKRSA